MSGILVNILVDTHEGTDGPLRDLAAESINYVQRQRLLDSIHALGPLSPQTAYSIETFTDAIRDVAPMDEPHTGMVSALIGLHNLEIQAEPVS